MRANGSWAFSWRAALLAAALTAGCQQPAHPNDSQSGGHGPGGGPHHPEGHAGGQHRFEDADYWAARFEDPERDKRQEPEHVLAVLALAPDAKVADIGSATGYFPVRFARAVPHGHVYGLDIEPDMVSYLNERAKREGLTNLTSILAAADAPHIPEPVDLIFLCNTYHHIEDRVNYFRARLADLRPGGRLVIIDYKPGELPYGPPPEHKVPPDQVEAELREAGYRLVQKDEGLEYQFFYIFTPAEIQAD